MRRSVGSAVIAGRRSASTLSGRTQFDLAIGSLDQPELARPADQIGVERRVTWFAELAGPAGAYDRGG
jgi:hypothetical protein